MTPVVAPTTDEGHCKKQDVSRDTASETRWSALVQTCQQGGGIRTTKDLQEILAWQMSHCSDGDEQKRFREDLLAFPQLLVFATMRKKSLFIHLVHSAGMYPNIPGADPCWKGKIVGFMGDKT